MPLFNSLLRTTRLLRIPPNIRVNLTQLQPQYRGDRPNLPYLPKEPNISTHRAPQKMPAVSEVDSHKSLIQRLNSFGTYAVNALKYNFKYHRASMNPPINLVAFPEFAIRGPSSPAAFAADHFYGDRFCFCDRMDINTNPITFEKVVVHSIALRIDAIIQQLTKPEERRNTGILLPVPIGLRPPFNQTHYSPVPITPVVNICIILIYDDEGYLHRYAFTSKQTVSDLDYPNPPITPEQRSLYSSSHTSPFVPLTQKPGYGQRYGLGESASQMPNLGRFANLRFNPQNPDKMGEPFIPLPWAGVTQMLVSICKDFGVRVVDTAYRYEKADLSVVVGDGIPLSGYSGVKENGLLWKVERNPDLIPGSSLQVQKGDKLITPANLQTSRRTIDLREPLTVRPHSPHFPLDPETLSATSELFSYISPPDPAK